jgi:hypothetical protein
MQPKTFYYISQTKIELLRPQLDPAISLPEISPKIELPGLGLGVDFKLATPDKSLVRSLLELLKKMKKRKLLRPLAETQKLESNLYYTDTAEWYHGLFAFRGALGLGDRPVRVISYLLWRPWNNAILLLAGSPQHIVGEAIVREGVYVYGTSGTLASILSFASQTLETGEPNLVGAGPQRSVAHPGVETLPWLKADAETLDVGEETLPPELPAASEALATGLMCVRYFSRLPKSCLELAFTPFRRLKFNRQADLPRWASELLNAPGLPDSLIDFFWKCRAIYIGSPLYTALVQRGT